MNDFIKLELDIVNKIKNDEMWYEGEKRHHQISPDDPVVESKVLHIVTAHIDEIENEAKLKMGCK